jgi:hypothetical protein
LLGATSRAVAEVEERVERFFGEELDTSAGAHVRITSGPTSSSCALATGVVVRDARTAGERGARRARARSARRRRLACAKARLVALAGWPAEDWLVDGVALACARTWYGHPLDEMDAARAARRLRAAHVRDRRTPAPHASPTSSFRCAACSRASCKSASAPTPSCACGATAAQPARSRPTSSRRHAHELRAPPPEPDRRASVASPSHIGIYLVDPRAARRTLASVIGSRDAERALDDLRALGFDALALAPIGAHTRSSRLAAACTEPFDRSASDAQWFATIAQARARGMAVMLTPQLRRLARHDLRRLGSRPRTRNASARSPSSISSSRTTALLAELAGADVLCARPRLSSATQSVFRRETRVDAGVHAPQRRALAREHRARASAFGGALTYAGRELAESERLEFWDALDYYGARPRTATLCRRSSACRAPERRRARSTGSRRVCVRSWLSGASTRSPGS